ncbi:hypothetical protein LU632_05630 [Erwinia tracheiphila]|uniref:hypothetical protein n=1 Tax=Erwinia tracheiphila TaxID=65700 RepID=UPI001F16E493|nr:hypothetical protein [Erwinia tracheiphila]UIA93054.1 hypothetical protein LU632_05630 [Erwinia tracheiphila]
MVTPGQGEKSAPPAPVYRQYSSMLVVGGVVTDIHRHLRSGHPASLLWCSNTAVDRHAARTLDITPQIARLSQH